MAKKKPVYRYAKSLQHIQEQLNNRVTLRLRRPTNVARPNPNPVRRSSRGICKPPTLRCIDCALRRIVSAGTTLILHQRNAMGCNTEIDDAGTEARAALPAERKARQMAPPFNKINTWKSIAVVLFVISAQDAAKLPT